MPKNRLSLLLIAVVLNLVSSQACKGTGPKNSMVRGLDGPSSTVQDQHAFVKVRDGTFTLNDHSFAFAGTNFSDLALSNAFSGDIQTAQVNGQTIFPQIDILMANYAKDGIKVLRLWSFACEGARTGVLGNPLIKQDRSLNDRTMPQLDYVIASAGRHGLKIILPLVNFEPEYCGMEWWVQNVLSASESGKNRLKWSCFDSKSMDALKIVPTNDCSSVQPKQSDSTVLTVPTRELFYTDPEITLAFQSHVKALLSRANIYTGRTYADEPAIMAIELANEPHTSDHYECLTTGIGMKTLEDCKRETPNPKLRGALVAKWLATTAAFVHANDRNHLVTSGEEGYRSSHQDPNCLTKNQWLHDGSKGVDFERNAAIPAIDFLTNHLYPDNWNVVMADLDWFNTCVIADRARIAKANNKPLILEESGFNNQAYSGKTSDYVKDRPYSMSRVYRYAVAAGYQGLMVWQATEMISSTEVAKRDSMTFPIVALQGDQLTYTAEGQVMVKAAECLSVFAGDLSRCVFLCATSVQVDSTGKGINPDGNICYRLAANASAPAFSATNQGTIITTSVAADQVGLASSTGGDTAGSTQTTADLYPLCPTGVVTNNGWGWTADKQLCQKSERTSAQLLSSGHCSCTAAP